MYRRPLCYGVVAWIGGFLIHCPCVGDALPTTVSVHEAVASRWRTDDQEGDFSVVFGDVVSVSPGWIAGLVLPASESYSWRTAEPARALAVLALDTRDSSKRVLFPGGEPVRVFATRDSCCGVVVCNGASFELQEWDLAADKVMSRRPWTKAEYVGGRVDFSRVLVEWLINHDDDLKSVCCLREYAAETGIAMLPTQIEWIVSTPKDGLLAFDAALRFRQHRTSSGENLSIVSVDRSSRLTWSSLPRNMSAWSTPLDAVLGDLGDDEEIRRVLVSSNVGTPTRVVVRIVTDRRIVFLALRVDSGEFERVGEISADSNSMKLLVAREGMGLAMGPCFNMVTGKCVYGDGESLHVITLQQLSRPFSMHSLPLDRHLITTVTHPLAIAFLNDDDRLVFNAGDELQYYDTCRKEVTTRLSIFN